MTKVIYMDLNRCTYCRSCEVACEREHDGVSHMFVQLVEERYAVPMNCRNCETNFCTLVCPTGAIHRETEDAVTISSMKCIGCGQCVMACPFGVIRRDMTAKVARKCDMCIHRTSIGLEPACVATCSARALSFWEFGEIVTLARRKTRTTVISRARGTFGTVVTLPMDGRGSSARE